MTNRAEVERIITWQCSKDTPEVANMLLALLEEKEKSDLAASSLIDVNTMLRTQLESTQSENTSLRAALAMSKDPCVYCQLPADEMAKCRSGFPGCARADDMSGCPEFGAAAELHYVRTQLANAQRASVGDWLWSQFMDYCKVRRTSPGTHDDLFAIVGRARQKFDTGTETDAHKGSQP